jgi:hypothetical protein
VNFIGVSLLGEFLQILVLCTVIAVSPNPESPLNEKKGAPAKF